MALFAIPFANALSLSQLAFDNGTIQTAGPRTGANGYNFLNIENGSGTFGSYGILDFNGTQTISSGTNPAPGTYGGLFSFGTTIQATSIAVRLTQDNASFTASGALNFYLATANITGTSNHTGSSPNFADNAAQFNPVLLGAGTFTAGTGTIVTGTGAPTAAGSGTLDTYTFNLSGTAQSTISGAVNAGTPVRIIVRPNDAVVAATYAGFSVFSTTDVSGWTPSPYNSVSTWRPQLTINANAVPEPASIAVLTLGALGFLRRRSRK